ncbi:MAG TPA: metallophosphoesterase [Spirochaetota bacterium]|nr:metallophosphoesterase [Spirochaetota bacterium]
MKLSNFIIFFTVALTIYGAGNFYVFIRGYHALPEGTALRRVYVALFLFLALSFILAEFSEKSGITCGNRFLVLTGSYWLAFLLYCILFIACIDIVRAADFFFHFLPAAEQLKAAHVSRKLMAIAAGLSLIITAAGSYAAAHPRIKTISLYIDKPKTGDPYLDIIMVSDIHLGNIITRKQLERLVGTINEYSPDIVLIPGDFFDENLRPVIQDNMGGLIESIKSRYGVFAVTGNHEYIGGVDDAVAYMVKHKIRVLRDEAVTVDGLVIIGREDRSMNRFTDRKRKDLGELVTGIDMKLPLIVMDHQPFNIKESADCAIDLHLSGHTHNGQMWPLNFITDRIYDVAFGYETVGRTQVYVSNGYGTWGPPVRTSGRPELVVFRVRFRE